jgi:Zn-dependent protease with chaperone function
MRKATLLLFVLTQLTVSAQVTIALNVKGIATKRVSSKITEGSKVEITEIKDNVDPNAPSGSSFATNTATVLMNGVAESISYNQLDKFTITPTNSKEFWIYQAIKGSIYKNLLAKGFQYNLRNELEDDAIEYLNYIKNNNLDFDDAYLESYLYSLAYKIYPTTISDGRPGTLNIKILKDITPNAFIFPNGTMFVTTGLLSTINSEDELIGVLAHEIAHFVLDHSVLNINKAIQRKKNAEFWASFATVAAAATEGYLMSKNVFYRSGDLTNSMAVISRSIASSIEERMGLKYSREQEMEADECAVELMKFISVNPLALSSALQKIKSFCILNGNYLALSGEGTHPALDQRIKDIGQPSIFNDIKYDRSISFVNTFNAIVELNDQHFVSCVNLAQRNINANVATEDDYMLVATATINMFDNEPKNLEAIELINKAKSLKVYPSLNLAKQEAIVLIRLKRLSEAKLCLLRYKDDLDAERLNNNKVIDTQQWSAINMFINKETEWTVKMISKVDKL